MFIPSISVATGGALYMRTSTELQPRIDELQAYKSFQTSRIFDRNGELLYEYVQEGRRDSVTLDQIADHLKDATVAIEDKTFWSNSGVDYSGIAKALLRNTASGDIVSGGFTVTFDEAAAQAASAEYNSRFVHLLFRCDQTYC
ncbi:MAG TPA: transglycosylase domain-containing protein, partial [Chloroflexota bacterium]|nr:transglycosylase domain-containing protein [Chloroflexota bacterium]